MAIVYKGRRSRRWREADHPRDPRTGEFVDKTGGHARMLMRIGDRTQGPNLGGGFVKSGGTLRPTGGQVGASSLKQGDHAKVAGVDQYGKSTSLNGYVRGPAQPVTMRQRGKRTPMFAIGVSETPSGAGGWHGTVYVPRDAKVQRTRPGADEARLEGVKAAPAPAPTPLAARLSDTIGEQRGEDRPNLTKIMLDAGIQRPPTGVGGGNALDRAKARLRRGDDPREVASDLRDDAREFKDGARNLSDSDSPEANSMRVTARILNDVADRLDAIDNQSGMQGKLTVDTPRVKQDDGGMAPTTPAAASGKPITNMINAVADELERDYPSATKPHPHWSGSTQPSTVEALRTLATMHEDGRLNKQNTMMALNRLAIKEARSAEGGEVAKLAKAIKKAPARAPKIAPTPESGKPSAIERLAGGKLDPSEMSGASRIDTPAFTPARDADRSPRQQYADSIRQLPGGALRGLAAELESGDVSVAEAADRLGQFRRSLAGRTMAENMQTAVADLEQRLRAEGRHGLGLDRPVPTPPATAYASITKRATLLAMLRARGLKAKRGAPDDDLRALLVLDDDRKRGVQGPGPVSARESVDDARTIEQLAGMKRAALLAVRRNTPGARTLRRGASEREIAEEIVRARNAVAEAAGARPGREVPTGPSSAAVRVIANGSSFTGNPIFKVENMEALTDADWKALTPGQQDNVRFVLFQLAKRQGEPQTTARVRALQGRFGTWDPRGGTTSPLPAAPTASTSAPSAPVAMSPLRLDAQIDVTERLIAQTRDALTVAERENRGGMLSDREIGLSSQLQASERKLRELQEEKVKRIGASPVAVPEASAGPKTLPPPLPWRPRDMGTIEARRNAVRDATMFRTDFDALPEDRKQAILTELREVVASGDTQTIPSNRTSMGTTIRGAEAPHVMKARGLLNNFLTARAAAPDNSIAGRAARLKSGEIGSFGALDGVALHEFPAFARAAGFDAPGASWKRAKAVAYLEDQVRMGDRRPKSTNPTQMAEALRGADQRQALAILDYVEAGTGLTKADMTAIARELGVRAPKGDKRAMMHGLAAAAKEAPGKAEAAPAAAPEQPKTMKARKGDLVAVQRTTRDYVTGQGSTERAEVQLAMVESVDRNGVVKSYRTVGWGDELVSDTAQKVDPVREKTLAVSQDRVDVRAVLEAAKRHTWPNSTQPKAFDSFEEAARVAKQFALKEGDAPRGPVVDESTPKGLRVGDRIRISEGREAVVIAPAQQVTGGFGKPRKEFAVKLRTDDGTEGHMRFKPTDKVRVISRAPKA